MLTGFSQIVPKGFERIIRSLVIRVVMWPGTEWNRRHEERKPIDDKLRTLVTSCKLSFPPVKPGTVLMMSAIQTVEKEAPDPAPQ